MTQVLYGAKGGSATTSNLYTINPSTAVASSVGAIGFAITGLAFDPTTGVLYGVTSKNSTANPKCIVTIDPVTGAGTLVGALGLGVDDSSDICFDSTGQMYGWSTDTTKFMQIDKATGAGTLVGGAEHSGSVSCNSSDVLYKVGFGAGENIDIVDKVTGARTVVSVLGSGPGAGGPNACAFNATGVLYALWNIHPAVHLVTIDPATGVVSDIAATDNLMDGLAWSVTINKGVSVAFGSDALAATPVYTRIDDAAVVSVQGWQTRRGRTYMTDRTEAGTASVSFIDTAGQLDPTNSTGPFYPMNPNCPFTIAIQHPITLAWHIVYTGLVQNVPTKLDVSAKYATGTINAADLFSLLAIDEIPPGLNYDSSSAGTNTANTIGDTTYAAQSAQDRMKAILADAGIPAARTDIFSGNVFVQFTTYPPGTQTLAALQDAADAEFPGVANLYCDKNNNVVFHGRKSRSDPTGTATGTDWVFTNWHVGDEPAVLANPTWGLITGLEFDRDVAKIINAAKIMPDGIKDSDIPGQLSTDTGSITQYGNRVYSADNLLTLGGETDGKNANDETKLMSDYLTGNFHDAQNQISQLTFQGVPSDAPYASATWDIICKVDIGDQVNVTTTHPGGGGFSAAPYFVDGISYTATNTGGSNFLNVTMTLDLSPAAYFTTAPFS